MSLIRADARRLPLRDGCVQTCVTSPPYFGLRDYGNGGQIGLESSPDAYVQSLLTVFAEVWRVLKDDGTLWLVIGDSYATTRNDNDWLKSGAIAMKGRFIPDGLKSKDLIGIPWRVAFALQAAGWYLRSDIIWSKPNPMPESVTDRPTKAHEYIFLLTKQERYYYDADAVAEPVEAKWEESHYRYYRDKGTATATTNPDRLDMGVGGGRFAAGNRFSNTRNKRSVWHVATQPYSGSHFATFPEALIEPCILAGSRPGDLVLDPFIGSGTVGTVCERFGRRWVGTDISYQHLSKERTLQRGLRWG